MSTQPTDPFDLDERYDKAWQQLIRTATDQYQLVEMQVQAQDQLTRDDVEAVAATVLSHLRDKAERAELEPQFKAVMVHLAETQ